MCVNPIEVFDMRMNSKGQGAMEYLMTYGWAILVVIIVGIVLWQSGVFGTGSGGISGFDKFRIKDYRYGAAGLNVSYENAAGQTVKKVNITYSGDVIAGASSACPLAGATCAKDSLWGGGVSNNWAPGKEYGSSLPAGNATSCATTGAGYTTSITIEYQTEAGLSHTESGTLRGKCE
jgi:hypothetical protein